MPPTHLMSINGDCTVMYTKSVPLEVTAISQTQIAFDVLILLALLFNLQVLNCSAYLCLNIIQFLYHKEMATTCQKKYVHTFFG